MTGNFKFGYLGNTSSLNKELKDIYDFKDDGKFIIGYFETGIPMIGTLFMGDRKMSVRIKRNLVYEIVAYRLLLESERETINSDLTRLHLQ